MARYFGEKRITPYYGNGRPAETYRNGVKLAGWKDQAQSGADLSFDDTYNDHVGILAQGRSIQPLDYYREVASAGVIQVDKHKEAALRGARVDTVAGQVVTVEGKNLFDKAKATTGYYLSGNGNIAVLSNAFVSAFIRVSASTVYVLSSVISVCFYDANKAYISTVFTASFTTPATCAFVRFDGSLTNINTAQLEAGSTATTYAAFVPNSPSPDYPAPIAPAVAAGGSAKARRCGKNFFTIEDVDSNSYFTKLNNNGFRMTGVYALVAKTNPKLLMALKQGVTYRCTRNFTLVSGSNTGAGGRIALYNPTTGAWLYIFSGAETSNPLTAPSNIAGYTSLYVYGSSGDNSAVLESANIQIEPGSTATPYEPYSGADYPLTPQAPMYGLPGAPDSIGADGAEKHPTKKYTFTGNETLYASSAQTLANGFRAYFQPSGIDRNYENGSAICSHFAFRGIAGNLVGISMTNVIFFQVLLSTIGALNTDSDATKIAKLKAFLTAQNAASTPVEIVYQLSTPVTYTNPAQAIALADGLNNLFSDVGTLNLSYQVSDGQNIAGDIASPTPKYTAIIIPSQATVYSENADASRQASMDTGILRAIPDGAGGWAARDTETIEWVGGERHKIRTQRVGHKVFTNETWLWISPTLYFTFDPTMKIGAPLICTRYPLVIDYAASDKVCSVNRGARQTIWIRDDQYAGSVDAFKAQVVAWSAAGNPMIVDYVLYTPIVTDLGPVDLPTYYRHTRIRATGEYLPDVQATCKVTDLTL